MTVPFIHLRLHTEYSLTEGMLRSEAALDVARQDRMPALAITDLNNLFGAVKFYTAARQRGIKPLIGCDVWVSNLNDRQKAYRLLLLAKNRSGYRRICELLTLAYRQNQYQGRAEVLPSWLSHHPSATTTPIGGDNTGLIALSGSSTSEIGRALINGDTGLAASAAASLAAQFPAQLYLEIQRVGDPIIDGLVAPTAALAVTSDLPLVATHPIHFLAADDFKAHETRVCIAHGYTLSDPRRPKAFTPHEYMKSQAEMASLFADYPEAIANTAEIAIGCNLSLPLGQLHLPQFPTPDGSPLATYFVARATDGLQRRLKRLFAEETQRAHQSPLYEARLRFETETIQQMGFSGYFLIVSDFIAWAKQNGCPVGPGRGSGAGSLVAYALGITDLDPIRHGLLFERFLNPERVSMPDFDIDFCQDNRGRVIEYVRHKYGADAVSQIVTFGTFASKAVIRDVGRALDLPYPFCDQLSKLIPSAPGKQFSLDEAVQLEPQLKTRLAQEEEVAELWLLAKKLEGLTRNVGMHAGGVLIAPGKLTEFCPLYVQPNSDATVSQFDKDDVESIGLVKFDFLGLRNLTIIAQTLDDIDRLHPDEPIELETLGFDDPETYRTLQAASTTAIFQLESEGMKKLLSKLKPSRFEDLIAVLALFRPGPLGSGMVDDFILRKNGKQKIDYFHPDLEETLESTYGVIVYQEQVMQISQIIGGYTLGNADLLRRAMGKKKTEEMETHKALFVSGAIQKGYKKELADFLFDLMRKFAEYGFNKSHTAAYAVISYHTAWLKTHHPAEFMAATLSSELDNTDQLSIIAKDAAHHKLTLLPPDINISAYRFLPVDRQQIRYALGAVKGTGKQAVEHLIQERETNGPFLNLVDFCQRTDKRTVNRRTVEALIRAGAFDALEKNRAALLASVSRAMECAEQANRDTQQQTLFDSADLSDVAEGLVDTPAWNEKTRLQQEKLAIGFYLSGHPFDSYRDELSPYLQTRLSTLVAAKTTQRIAGILVTLRTKTSARGKIAILTLDDTSATIDVTLYNEIFQREREKLKEDTLLIIEGKVSPDEYSGGLRIQAEKILTVEEARKQFLRHIEIAYRSPSEPQRLLDSLQPYRNANGTPLRLRYQSANATACLELGNEWRVLPNDTLLQTLGHHGAVIHLKLVY